MSEFKPLSKRLTVETAKTPPKGVKQKKLNHNPQPMGYMKPIMPPRKSPDSSD